MGRNTLWGSAAVETDLLRAALQREEHAGLAGLGVEAPSPRWVVWSVRVYAVPKVGLLLGFF